MADTFDPFLERDFLAYEKHRQDDPEYNALRLSVRRKLKKIVDEVKKRAKSEASVELAVQAGLHHPYVFNSYRVREQRAYLCRSNKERKKLASFFGEALGKDAETHYIQPVLEVSIDDQVVEAALRIHPLAWWDGEFLKKQVATDEGRAEWCQMLNALPAGFGLKLHDWRKVYWSQSVRAGDLSEYFGSYTPGEHWLHLVRELPREDAIAMGLDAPQWIATSLLALLPLYRSVLWTP
ncbi:MAG: hypothetical protein AAF628_18875 [Planctomycetota bacterium]